MPELPDVEIFRERVSAEGLEKEIVEVKVFDDEILQNTTENQLSEALKGHSFQKAERVGKYLYIKSNNGKNVEMHFGMTGKPCLLKNGEKPDHTRAVFEFSSGEKLAFSDTRKFGHISLVEDCSEIKDIHNLGTDALVISEGYFVESLKNSRAMIKSALMNQEIIAGVGNIYADEILFQSKVHPKSTCIDLGEKELKRIYKNIKPVLRESIKYLRYKMNGQTSGNIRKKLPSNYLLNNRKEGAECPGSCRGQIQKTKVTGRATYYCPECQSKA